MSETLQSYAYPQILAVGDVNDAKGPVDGGAKMAFFAKQQVSSVGFLLFPSSTFFPEPVS